MINSLSSLLTIAELSALQILQAGSSYTFTFMLSSLCFHFFKENNRANLLSCPSYARFPRKARSCQDPTIGVHTHTSPQIIPFSKSKNAFVSTCSWSPLNLPVVSVLCTSLLSLLSCVIFRDPLIEPVQEDSRSFQAPDSFQSLSKPWFQESTRITLLSLCKWPAAQCHWQDFLSSWCTF